MAGRRRPSGLTARGEVVGQAERVDPFPTLPPALTFVAVCLVLLPQYVLGKEQGGWLACLSGREGPEGEADAGLDARLALQASTPAAPTVR